MCDLAYKSSSNPLGPGGSNIRKIVCFHAVLLMRSAECWRQNSWRDSVWPYPESSETCLLTLSGIFLSQKTPFEWNLCCQLGTHRWTLCRNLPGTCQPSQNSPSCQSHGGNEMPEGHGRETLLQGHWISEMFNQPTSILLKKTLRPAKPLRGVSGESHVSWSMTWQKDLHAQCPCDSKLPSKNQTKRHVPEGNLTVNNHIVKLFCENLVC